MTEPRRPQQLRAKRTHRALIAAARHVFAEQGYAGASVDDVARAAGCSKGAYYFHFESKEAVLVALIRDWAKSRARRLSLLAGQTESSLDGALNALLTFEPGEPRLIFEFWSEAWRSPVVARAMQEAEQGFRALLAEALSRSGAQSDLTPELLLTLQRGSILQACFDRRVDGHIEEAGARLLGSRPAIQRAAV
jgi:AcrR family transcriptional regulator